MSEPPEMMNRWLYTIFFAPRTETFFNRSTLSQSFGPQIRSSSRRILGSSGAHAFVDDQHRLVGERVEILSAGRTSRPKSRLRRAASRLPPLKGFCAEMVPERMQESGIDAMFGRAGARLARQLLDGGDAARIGAAYGKLDACTRHTGWKTTVFGHVGQVRHFVYPSAFADLVLRLGIEVGRS